MKRRLLLLLLAICMVMTIMPIATAYAASTTTVPAGYTAIYTASDLDAVRNNLSGNYILMNDIDLGSWDNWIPIGEDLDRFTGTFDGNEHSILNMHIVIDGAHRYIDKCAGLFGATADASIMNIYKITGSITMELHKTYVGGIVGSAVRTSITKCTSYVTIDYNDGQPGDTTYSSTWSLIYAGGIVGRLSGENSNEALIAQCANHGDISIIAENVRMHAGGIVGEAEYSLIYDCYNTGDVSADSAYISNTVGGIVGTTTGVFQGGNIRNCYNAGDLVCLAQKASEADRSSNVGGIAGYVINSSNTHLTNCYYKMAGLSPVGTSHNWEKVKAVISSVESVSESAMANRSVYDGFNFSDVWTMGKESYKYPMFIWEGSVDTPVPDPTPSPTLTRYMVTFDATGGYTSSVAMSVVVGRTYGELPVPTRTGYTFEGWYTAEIGGVQITSSTEVQLSADQTLYAHWKESVASEKRQFVVSFNANGGQVGVTSKTVKNGETYGVLPTASRNDYNFDGWFTSANGGTQIVSTTMVALTENQTLYAHWTSAKLDIYNLGDETYSFKNYHDSDSVFGHCFGMSITSAGYHNNLLDIRQIGGNTNTPLYSFGQTKTVEKPICYYQKIQGSYGHNAIVAGGSFYLKGVNNIALDWENVVNFVKNHDYDNTGLLQVGFSKGKDGHAINFLRYENVNGQDRIYAYDNNFPDQEIYFYQDSLGNVIETPKQTFRGAIDCIALRDIRIYFSLVGDFDASHVLYMAEDAATVQGYTYSYMEGAFSDEVYVMYEIPANVDKVVIIPKRDNAEFIYMDTTYSFGEVTDETRGELTLASGDSDTASTNAEFKMYDGDLLLSSFVDVPVDAYYYDAVQWAVENGITTGTSATTFSPNANCTRGQIVTFLWRANGSPEPTSTNNPFKDVNENDYYYKAVLWAVENEITTGTSAITFSPNEVCTRGQAVTFLYRAEQSPSVTGSNNFTDVRSDEYYFDAVTWAVVNEITTGTSNNTFSPNSTCTRAQIVTFLWRDMK